MAQNPVTTPTSVDVILVGGPVDIPRESRLCRVEPSDDKVKLGHGSGYEHFERTDDTEAERRVFRWTTRTYIAE